MKEMILSLFCLGISSWSLAQPQIKMLELVHNYDTLKQGEPVSNDFKFVNTGDEPLIITKANTSCGCDIPRWDKAPIMPGDTGVVNYRYDSKRIGAINKTMTITSNDPVTPIIVVRNIGFVLPKEE